MPQFQRPSHGADAAAPRSRQRQRALVRVAIEHAKCQLGLFVRSVGLAARAAATLGLTNLVTNMIGQSRPSSRARPDFLNSLG